MADDIHGAPIRIDLRKHGSMYGTCPGRKDWISTTSSLICPSMHGISQQKEGNRHRQPDLSNANKISKRSYDARHSRIIIPEIPM